MSDVARISMKPHEGRRSGRKVRWLADELNMYLCAVM